MTTPAEAEQNQQQLALLKKITDQLLQDGNLAKVAAMAYDPDNTKGILQEVALDVRENHPALATMELMAAASNVGTKLLVDSGVVDPHVVRMHQFTQEIKQECTPNSKALVQKCIANYGLLRTVISQMLSNPKLEELAASNPEAWASLTRIRSSFAKVPDDHSNPPAPEALQALTETMWDIGFLLPSYLGQPKLFGLVKLDDSQTPQGAPPILRPPAQTMPGSLPPGKGNLKKRPNAPD